MVADHLVVFNSAGGRWRTFIADYPVFQQSLQGRLRGAAVRVGRLKRDGQGYVLERLDEGRKERVRDALMAEHLIGDDDGLPSRHEQRVKAEAATRAVREDDDGGF